MKIHSLTGAQTAGPETEADFLVICSGGKEIAVAALPGEKAGKAALSEIAGKAPHIQIGKPKDGQENGQDEA